MGLFDPGSGLVAGLVAGTPQVPSWTNINLDQQQTNAIAANQASLPSLEGMASNINLFNQGQLTQLFNNVMPGWSNMSQTATGNIASELQGKVPTDVSNAIQSSDAAQALTGGFGGSGLSGNKTARDLGLTSLNLIQQGQSSLQSWTSMIDQMFTPGQFNVSSMFVTPQQEFQDTFANQESKWNVDWLKNQVNWSGSFGELLGNEINTTSQQFNGLMSSIVSKYAGSMAGGMGGGGGGGMGG